MNNNFQKSAGIYLVLGALLATVTMVLHPSGGSNEHILKISRILITSHTLALLSLPLLAYGFYALSSALSSAHSTSFLGFIIMAFGLVAVMLDGVFNGITLPLFLSGTKGTDPAILEAIRKYGWAISKPMSYIFIVASSLSVLIWSILLLRRSAHLKLLGLYGIAIVLIPVAAFLLSYSLIGLRGFSIYVLGIVGWIVWASVLMITGKLSTSTS